ncbi:MAG: FAD-dependent oxidoreductase [Patescibacteria group bacterium]
MQKVKYLIIGGGIAGTTAAETIHQNDRAGSIAIVSEEPYPLYSRIMLSKHNFYLPEGENKIWLKTPDWYAKENIGFLLGRTAIGLDANKKIVRLDNGEEVEYEKLLIATGSCARKWIAPGSDKKGVFSLRVLDDAKAIKEKMKTAKKAVAIGGGFISFEICDIARQFDIDMTLILRESYYWEPILDKNEAAVVEGALAASGVKTIKNTEVSEVVGGELVEGVILKNGSRIDCDMIIAGVGVVCALDWLSGSGLKANRGILANEYLETNFPDIWAAGDVAEFDDLILEERVQLGNWLNARQQGRIAGLNMVGEKTPFLLVTSYSTAGFGITISFIGDVRPSTDRTMISRGDPGSKSRARIIIKDGEIVGATLINLIPELHLMSKLIEINFKVSGHENELADHKFDLKTLIQP